MKREKIVVLDFGSQYTQLIARRIRELRVYCEIHPFNVGIEMLKDQTVQGVILSGGPSSVHENNSPHPNPDVFKLDKPVLGICYGCQLLGYYMNATISRADQREYGPAQIDIIESAGLFDGLTMVQSHPVWMSHGDILESLPDGAVVLAQTQNSPYAAIAYPERRLYGLQFHPEVSHTPCGSQILRNFVVNICGCRPTWTPKAFIEEAINSIRIRVGNGRIICGLSGGIDSAVVAMLLDRAVKDQLIAVFVDNGILRYGEAENVESIFKTRLENRFVFIDASSRFMNALRGISDPESKRKIIGEEFIRVFESHAQHVGNIEFLAQGTLYPDVIESISVKGPSSTIKSHHNVGGLPDHMQMKLVEPLRNLFKDEVREVGSLLGLPDEIVWRQPFPGPGLAVRILGEVTGEKVRILQKADKIVREEISRAKLMKSLWQAFAVLLPIQTVGVMGDERTYDAVCAVRAVISKDAMTADWARLPHDVLATISSRIINEVDGINRVVYDISSKPPSTIEWE